MKRRRFTLSDQDRFAQLSGDYNPLHMDPIAARRYLYGSPVVHGVHALLWALDCWLGNDPEPVNLSAIQVSFLRAIPLEVQIDCSVTCEQPDRVQIELRCEGSVSTRIAVGVDPSGQQQSRPGLDTGLPDRQIPNDLSADEIERDSGRLDLYFHVETAAKLIPHLIKQIPSLQVAVILSTSRLVGMKCPGLHSLYSGLSLVSVRNDSCENRLEYEVTKLDRRFSSVLMQVTAPGMSGSIQAFQRPLPQEQAAYLCVKENVVGDEFADQRALVIGGSRGLGEVTAKIISAGGGDVKITYFQGDEDARRVVHEITSDGGIAGLLKLDVRSSESRLGDLLGSSWRPTHLYYFATPFIFSGEEKIFTPELFQEFCDYYVIGFLNVVNQLEGEQVTNVFYPSTIAIDELPVLMGEYAAAKTAGETLCSFLQKTRNDLFIHRPRLPRIATDQTVSLLPDSLMTVSNEDPVPLLIHELRHFRDSSTRADS